MQKLTLNVTSYILLVLSILLSHFRSQCSGYFFPFPYSFPSTLPAPASPSRVPVTTSSMSYGSPLFNMAPYQDKTEIIVVGRGKGDQQTHHHHHHHHHKHGHQHSHGHEHAHDHSHNHGHQHGHEHKHDHGHNHDHKHGHQHGHDHHHGHTHDHNNIHNHNHGHHHSHGHLHGHVHDQNHQHNHAHQHGHSHAHGHNHEHGHIHGHIGKKGHDRLIQQINFQHQNNLSKFVHHTKDHDDKTYPTDHSGQQNKDMFDDQEGDIKYVSNQGEQSNNNDNSFNGHGFNQNYQQLDNSGEQNADYSPRQEQQNEQQNFLMEEPEIADPGPALVPLRQKNFLLLAKDVQTHSLGDDGQIQSYGVHLGQTQFVQDSDTVHDKQESMSILTILRQNGRIVTLGANDPLVSIHKPLRLKQDYIDITLGSDGLKSRLSTGLELTPDEDYETSIGKFDEIYNVQEYD